jgi:hypothetical protein
MRAITLLLGLSLVAGACVGAESEQPKPYWEQQIDVTFPVTLGSYSLKKIDTFAKPELGVMIRYEIRQPYVIWADIFVYDLGRKGLGTGTGNPEVKSHFEVVKSDITATEQKGRYKGVKLLSEGVISVKMGAKDLPMYSAVYEYVIVPESGESDGYPVFSQLYLTAYKDRFLKVRCTYSKLAKETGDVTLKAFLTALGDILK